MVPKRMLSLISLLASVAYLASGGAVSLAWRDIPARCVAAGPAQAAWCAAAGSDSLAPHPADCELFLYCMDGQAAVCRQCPAGLHFSPSLHVCASPDVAGCLARSTAPPRYTVPGPEINSEWYTTPEPTNEASP